MLPLARTARCAQLFSAAQANSIKLWGRPGYCAPKSSGPAVRLWRPRGLGLHPLPRAPFLACTLGAAPADAGMGSSNTPAFGDSDDDDEGPPDLEDPDDIASKPPPPAGGKAAAFGGAGGFGAGAAPPSGGDLSDDDDEGPPGLEEGERHLQVVA